MRSSTYKRKPYNHCCSFNTRVVLLSVQCAWTGCCTENMFPIYPPVNGAARRTRELRSTIFAEWRSGMLAFALAACGFADALRAGLSHQACGKTCRRHASAIACDSWLCELRALRVTDLKFRLSAAGVDTAGMFEKEDLVTALLAVQPSAPPPFFEAALREEDGGLYTSVKNGQDETLRLLVDTGAARSVLSSRHHGNVVAAELDCPSLGLTGLDCAVADLPSDVDGIIGFDAMRGFAATELDLSSGRLRLHNRAYSATHDEGGRGVSGREGMSRAELTRTPRGLRRVRTGYAYQPPALGTYRTHRAACPQAPRTVRTGYTYQPRALGTYRVPWQPRSRRTTSCASPRTRTSSG